MRRIQADQITKVVAKLCIQANTVLRPDVLNALKSAFSREKNKRAKHALQMIIENASIAKKQGLAICQDTGLPVVFVEVGKGVLVAGSGIEQAIQNGVVLGYKKASLRNSIIQDPLRLKSQKPQFGPAITHYEYSNSNKLKITVLPKGFGCENKSKLKMFLPTADFVEIKKFILDAVKEAGPDACPPYVIGIGIGGSADYTCLLAKKALLEEVTKSQSHKVTSSVLRLEQELLQDINRLGIGPMGLGGKTTALAVRILTHPTHIAGLPVAVNISCHALRSATAIL